MHNNIGSVIHNNNSSNIIHNILMHNIANKIMYLVAPVKIPTSDNMSTLYNRGWEPWSSG